MSHSGGFEEKGLLIDIVASIFNEAGSSNTTQKIALSIDKMVKARRR